MRDRCGVPTARGSIGIALLATQLDWREKLHSFRLSENITAFSSAVSERLTALTQGFVSRGSEAVTAGNQALGALAGVVRREAFVMAYSDCFFLLAVILAATILLVWPCRPAKGSGLGAH